MGRDKATLLWQRRPLVEHAVTLLRTVMDEVSVVGSRPDLAKYAPVVADRRTGCGPLSGIEAALAASSGYALFIPVDLPMLPPAFLRLLVARVVRTGALCTLAKFQGVSQPLCAIYHHCLLPALTESLNAGDYKVMRVMLQAAAGLEGSIDLFDLEAVWAAEGREGQAYPRPDRIFLNCNTPREFTKIVQQVQ